MHLFVQIIKKNIINLILFSFSAISALSAMEALSLKDYCILAMLPQSGQITLKKLKEIEELVEENGITHQLQKGIFIYFVDELNQELNTEIKVHDIFKGFLASEANYIRCYMIKVSFKNILTELDIIFKVFAFPSIDALSVVGENVRQDKLILFDTYTKMKGVTRVNKNEHPIIFYINRAGHMSYYSLYVLFFQEIIRNTIKLTKEETESLLKGLLKKSYMSSNKVDVRVFVLCHLDLPCILTVVKFLLVTQALAYDEMIEIIKNSQSKELIIHYYLDIVKQAKLELE